MASPLAPLVLAIDQGTSSTKCLAVDEGGRVVARGQAALGETHPEPGWVEQDGEGIWRSVGEALAACLSDADARRVVAVGFSTQRESLLAWDRRTLAPLSPVLSWQDRRTADMRRRIGTPEVERFVREASGLPLDPMFSALKARWLLDALDPDRVRARSGEIALGTIDSWCLAKLGGGHVIEAGNSSRTQLLDVRRGDWHQDLLEIFGVPRQALPEIVSSTGPFPTTRGLAPLPDGVPVAAVMGDSHAALFAHGAFRPGAVKATFGTGSSVMGLVGDAARLDQGLCLTIAWAIDGLTSEDLAHAAEGNIRSSGATLRWMADILGMSTDALVEAGLAADAAGISLVPGFNGLGAPYWDEKAVGLLSGFTLGATRAQLARAALESIPHQVADVVDAIDRSVGRVEALHADGGPTRTAGLMQMQADLAGRPVNRADTGELSALGAAHLAGLSADLWSWEALAHLPRPHTRFEPALGDEARAAARRDWRSAVARSRGRLGQPDDAGEHPARRAVAGTQAEAAA